LKLQLNGIDLQVLLVDTLLRIPDYKINCDDLLPWKPEPQSLRTKHQHSSLRQATLALAPHNDPIWMRI
jgi:hypothetical protein